MTQATNQKPMSPINIDQNRAVGQDSPTEGSRMGREANKTHGYPGEAEMANASGGTDAASSPPGGESDDALITASPLDEQSREEAVRQAAYEAYERRGGAPGSEVEDWFEAEARIGGMKSKM